MTGSRVDTTSSINLGAISHLLKGKTSINGCTNATNVLRWKEFPKLRSSNWPLITWMVWPYIGIKTSYVVRVAR